MAQIEQLLKYQSEDEKLLRLERETANSDERKNYSQAKAFLTKAPEKLEGLEAKANELTKLLEQLNKQYSDIYETLQDFENLDELIDGGADVTKADLDGHTALYYATEAGFNDIVEKLIIAGAEN